MPLRIFAHLVVRSPAMLIARPKEPAARIGEACEVPFSRRVSRPPDAGDPVGASPAVLVAVRRIWNCGSICATRRPTGHRAVRIPCRPGPGRLSDAPAAGRHSQVPSYDAAFGPEETPLLREVVRSARVWRCAPVQRLRAFAGHLRPAVARADVGASLVSRARRWPDCVVGRSLGPGRRRAAHAGHGRSSVRTRGEPDRACGPWRRTRLVLGDGPGAVAAAWGGGRGGGRRWSRPGRHPAPVLRGMGAGPTRRPCAHGARAWGRACARGTGSGRGAAHLRLHSAVGPAGRECLSGWACRCRGALSARSSARRSLRRLALAGLLGLVARRFSPRSFVAPAHDILEATRRLAEASFPTHHRRGSDELALLAQGVDSRPRPWRPPPRPCARRAARTPDLENSVAGYFVTTATGVLWRHAAWPKFGTRASTTCARSSDIGGQFTPARRKRALLATLRKGPGSAAWRLRAFPDAAVSDNHRGAGPARRGPAHRGNPGLRREITERKRAELILAEANSASCACGDSQHDPLFVADAETDIILYANLAALSAWDGPGGAACWAAMHGGRSRCGQCPRSVAGEGRPVLPGVCSRDARARHRGWSMCVCRPCVGGGAWCARKPP
jgi:hypothetical protein